MYPKYGVINQNYCWDLTGMNVVGMWDSSTGGIDTTQAKCSCGPGTYFKNGLSCESSPAGTWARGRTGIYFPCDAGTFASSTGMTSCSICDLGKVSIAGSSVCVNSCPAGSITAGQGCILCVAGQYSSNTTAVSSCTSCDAGKASTAGSIACGKSCPIGQYQNGDGCFYLTAATLRTAVTAWCSNPTTAAITYGDISIWDVSMVGDMAELFNSYCGSKETFNADVSSWDVSG